MSLCMTVYFQHNGYKAWDIKFYEEDFSKVLDKAVLYVYTDITYLYGLLVTHTIYDI